jgi:hypothetical protein
MNKNFRMVHDALMMVFQMGISMLVPIIMCTLVGVWLGEILGINWLAVPGFFVGALAGYTGIFKMVRKFIKTTDRNKQKDVKKD